MPSASEPPNPPGADDRDPTPSATADPTSAPVRGGGGRVLDGTWLAAVADDDLRRDYPDVGFDDRAWAPIEVPGHWRTNEAFAATDGPVLHRHRFGDLGTFGPGADRADEADEPRRSWLVLDGVFYTSDVWLDGAYLGDTEGYFFPHTFEITDSLALQSEHVLAMEVSCRPETDLGAKRNLTGVFQDGDQLDRDWNPGGIWRQVRIEQTGPVRIRHFRATCRDATDAVATVAIRAVLDTIASRTVELVTTIGGVEHRRDQPLASGENRVEWTVTVPRPRRWWPHALGEPAMHDLTVEVVNGDGIVSDRRRRRIGLRSIELRDWIASVNGERLFLKGSNASPTRIALGEATAGELARDVELAKAANLDFLRVHAHVSRPELYDAADAAGMLVWQDMPLRRGYHRSIRGQARRQARELVDLLGHHPSIFVWCGHESPAGVDTDPDPATGSRRRTHRVARRVAAQALPTWNKSVLDHSIRRVLEHTDGSRPVVPHSGVLPHPPLFEGTDTHAWFGWSYGSAGDLAPALRWWPRLARFVSELGAQAVPDDAAFLDPQRWPDLDWDRAQRHHALQKATMDAVVPPDAFDSFDAWRTATQAYQADLIRTQVETLRRLKYRPCGGFAQYSFADGFPAVTWSVLDHERQPKVGYGALRDACAPVVVITDPLPGEVAPGERIEADIHVVSDLRVALSDLILSVRVRADGTVVEPGPVWTGTVPPDSCVRVGRLDLLAPARRGPATIELELRSSHDDAAAAASDGHPRHLPVVRRATVVVR